MVSHKLKKLENPICYNKDSGVVPINPLTENSVGSSLKINMKNMNLKLSKLEAINELQKYDHCFLYPKEVERLTKPFGFKGVVRIATDTRFQHKGLNLGKDFKEGDTAEGQDADVVACEIARHLGVEYTTMFGRGSALRECCRAVREHLEK